MTSLGQQQAATELLERSDLLAALSEALEQASAGRGSLLLLGGEAGVGKTALLQRFCAAQSAPRVLWGSCERLFTPRALGSLVDIFEEAGIELPGRSPQAWAPHAFVVALVDELQRKSPTVLVVEDIHWADEGTLDVIKLLARRIGELPALALVSFRDDQLTAADPLQIVLGELAAAPSAHRRHVPPLTLAAVTELALPTGLDPERLFEKTGGNPFFVTEALAAMDAHIPDTVRDAVLARAAQLAPPARRMLEAAAVVPGRIELWLLDAVAGEDLAELEECLRSGMLREDHAAVAFRHELARLSIEDAISPNRRLELHRAVLAALAGSSSASVDPARLSHHADQAGDHEAVLRYAPAAGERAAELCAHRLAAEQFGRALSVGERLPVQRRAHLYERRSYECYLTGQITEAVQARRSALALHEQCEDRVRQGDSHRWLSRLVWFAGDSETARAEGGRAIELLEREPPGRELAMAYSNAAQLSMLAGDVEGATGAGERAIALAERLHEREILVHALNNVGTAQASTGAGEGFAKLERSLAQALDGGYEEHVARAYANLGSISVRHHELEAGERYLTDGIAYCEDNDLDAWTLYMTGWEAQLRLIQGRWDLAAEQATAVLRRPDVALPSRVTPLVVLGRLRARRGDPDPWTPLDEARALAVRTGELQRLAPVAAARAEALLLTGAGAGVGEETEEAFVLAQRRTDPWALGELCRWRRKAGIEDVVAPESVPPPAALELSGEWAAAAGQWRALGCPYEAALALAQTDDERALNEALAAFQGLGAVPAARATAQRLRSRGVRSVFRGPRRSTLENPAQLTSRQLEILGLLGERLTNVEIAARLFISPRTVDHHVSAILDKLEVGSRREAAAEAVRLGVVAKWAAGRET